MVWWCGGGGGGGGGGCIVQDIAKGEEIVLKSAPIQV